MLENKTPTRCRGACLAIQSLASSSSQAGVQIVQSVMKLTLRLIAGICLALCYCILACPGYTIDIPLITQPDDCRSVACSSLQLDCRSQSTTTHGRHMVVNGGNMELAAIGLDRFSFNAVLSVLRLRSGDTAGRMLAVLVSSR